MKKITISLLSIILLSGCKINYNLEFENGAITENLKFDVSNSEFEEYKNRVEDEIITEDINTYFDEVQIPINKDNPEIFHDKYINKGTNKVDAEFEYIYSYNNFNTSYILNNCFNDVITINEEDYYYIKATGPFACSFSDTTISIKTDKEVINTNAKYKDGLYTWNITENNVEDIELIFHIDKNSDFDESKVNEEIEKKNNKQLINIVWLVLLTVFLILLILLLKKKKNKLE